MTKTVRVLEKGSVFRDVIMENTPQNVVYTPGDADFTVLMPEYTQECSGVSGILLLPGKMRDCGIIAREVITYGMASCDTITLSSVGINRCVLAVQREFITLWNQVVEPQEIVIPRMNLAPDYAMATATAIIIAGNSVIKNSISTEMRTYISKQEVYGGIIHGRIL